MTLPPALIMLVEDNKDHAELMMNALKNHDFNSRVIWFKTGESALACLFQQNHTRSDEADGQPDMILLDIKLPGITGIDVLQKIKNNPWTKRIPTIMLTTSGNVEEIARCYDLGANSYISKPVDYDKFREKLANLKLYWVLTTELPQSVQAIPAKEKG